MGNLLEKIVSRDNARLKHLRKLIDDRAYRYASHEYVVEGPRALSERVPLSAVFVSAGVPVPATADGPVFEVEPRLFDAIAPTEHTQGILAIAPMTLGGPDDLDPSRRYVFLDRLQDPGNAGTIVRSAAAFGMDGVIVTPGCVDVFSPKAVRASAGTVALIPIIAVEDVSALAAHIILALDAGGGDLRAFSWPAGFVLAVGGEARGLSPEISAAARAVLAVPMAPDVESLNAAVTASLAMFVAPVRKQP